MISALPATVAVFAGVPVPFTASWTAEDHVFLATCPYARGLAICQREARGIGRPRFAKPHFSRQRQVIAEWRCDLCFRSLRNRTMISLSHARPRANGATGINVLQVEPLLHRECAAICIQHCPSLKRDLESGTFEARVVTKARVQIAVANPEFVAEYVPGFVPTPGAPLIAAHAKVELLKSRTIDVNDLERREGGSRQA